MCLHLVFDHGRRMIQDSHSRCHNGNRRKSFWERLDPRLRHIPTEKRACRVNVNILRSGGVGSRSRVARAGKKSNTARFGRAHVFFLCCGSVFRPCAENSRAGQMTDVTIEKNGNGRKPGQDLRPFREGGGSLRIRRSDLTFRETPKARAVPAETVNA